MTHASRSDRPELQVPGPPSVAEGWQASGRSASALPAQTGVRSEAARAAPARYKMTPWRVICGLCWGLWTAGFTVAAFASLSGGQFGTFLGGAVLGGLAGWYDYRIWTGRARRLTLFLIF